MTRALARFWLGLGGGTLTCAVVFREAALPPGSIWLTCVTATTLLATMLTIVRLVPANQAAPLSLLLSAGYSAMSAGLTLPRRTSVAVAGLLIGVGSFAVAWLFEELAGSSGRRVRAAIAGFLLGGVWLAVGPVTSMGHTNSFGAVPRIVADSLAAATAGAGVALGVELAEWLTGQAHTRMRAARPPAG